MKEVKSFAQAGALLLKMHTAPVTQHKSHARIAFHSRRREVDNERERFAERAAECDRLTATVDDLRAKLAEVPPSAIRCKYLMGSPASRVDGGSMGGGGVMEGLVMQMEELRSSQVCACGSERVKDYHTYIMCVFVYVRVCACVFVILSVRVCMHTNVKCMCQRSVRTGICVCMHSRLCFRLKTIFCPETDIPTCR